MRNNKYFIEHTKFGKKPHRLFYSTKLKLKYVVVDDKCVFEDGAVYGYEEIKSLDMDVPSNQMLMAIHAAKLVFKDDFVLLT